MKPYELPILPLVAVWVGVFVVVVVGAECSHRRTGWPQPRKTLMLAVVLSDLEAILWAAGIFVLGFLVGRR